MTATLHLFARFRERAGRASITVPAGVALSELRLHLKGLWPDMTSLVDVSRFAADDEFVEDDFSIRDGGELAVIPPVSGGEG